MEQIAIQRSIWINAPRERVWQALTDPQQVAQWFAPGVSFKSSGSEVGARLYVEHPETGAALFVQVLEVVEPPHRLVLRSQPAPPETPFVTMYQLEEEGQGTRLMLTFAGYEGVPDASRQQLMDEHGDGFDLMLGNVKAFIEGTDLPRPEGF